MDGKLRNMTSIYITKGDKMLLLFRKGGRIVSDTWVGSAGGHFEENELNDPKACVLRELKEELGISEKGIRNLLMRYVTLRRIKGEIRMISAQYRTEFTNFHYENIKKVYSIWICMNLP